MPSLQGSPIYIVLEVGQGEAPQALRTVHEPEVPQGVGLPSAVTDLPGDVQAPLEAHSRGLEVPHVDAHQAEIPRAAPLSGQVAQLPEQRKALGEEVARVLQPPGLVCVEAEAADGVGLRVGVLRITGGGQ